MIYGDWYVNGYVLVWASIKMETIFSTSSISKLLLQFWLLPTKANKPCHFHKLTNSICTTNV